MLDLSPTRNKALDRGNPEARMSKTLSLSDHPVTVQQIGAMALAGAIVRGEIDYRLNTVTYWY